MNFRLNNRPARNPVDLQADSATVRYDLDMLVEAAHRYADAEVRKDFVGMNLAVESFAIHCRAMIQFLFGHLERIEGAGNLVVGFSAPRLTDVFAHDYYLGWRNDCPAPTAILADAKWRADKHVAHITSERRGVNQPGTGIESVWPLAAVVHEIARAMSLFLSKAPEANFDAEDLRKMKARLAQLFAHTAPTAPAVPFIGKSGPLDDPWLR
jgi:hypothetical protein